MGPTATPIAKLAMETFAASITTASTWGDAFANFSDPLFNDNNECRRIASPKTLLNESGCPN